MLAQIYIQNVAVIEKVTVELGLGLNAFTGETGAGKSILINAINAITGGRTSKDIVRTGADKAVISAVFSDISDSRRQQLADLGYELEEGEDLLVMRTVSADGKSSCKINGIPATISMLKEATAGLADIYGQHDTAELMAAEKHIAFVDGFADNAELIKEYRENYSQMRRIEKDIEKLVMDERDKEQLISILQYQVDEIDAAELEPGEEEELDKRRKLIKNSEKLAGIFADVEDCMNGTDDGDGALTLLDNFRDSFEQLSEFYPELAESVQRANEIYYELEEMLNDVRSYSDDIEFDPMLLDSIERRLDIIYRLKRKYGGSIDEILAFGENARTRLDDISFSDEKLEKLKRDLAVCKKEAAKKAEELSQKRREGAKVFAERVMEELKFLDMPNVIFSVKAERTELSENGIDKLEFMISTNPGEPAKPLAKTASGGELSRIMLSIKNVVSDKDGVETLIFDEIDTGVSGRAAYKIGKKLKEVSNGRQILCVTHLAQVAAFADNHLLIKKDVRNGRTFTGIYPLERDERIAELARIGGGDVISETMLKNAEEMLDKAQM
ncbi:MAG: DNA repair protein RecN [Oscillospiraceae bacterium]|nr:DNA repair protein RecN [Oscillospiraceae bacterium]